MIPLDFAINDIFGVVGTCRSSSRKSKYSRSRFHPMRLSSLAGTERVFDVIVRGAELQATADYIVAMTDVACLIRYKMGYVNC